MTITEVGLMGVKPNHQVMDEKTPEGQALSSVYKKVGTLPGGPSRVYWGLEVENPLMLWAFFDWETLEQHETFAKAYGAELVKEFPKILTHGEFSKHATFMPSSLPLQSPVTEVILAYFRSDLSTEGKETAMEKFQQFLTGLDGVPGMKGTSLGWGLENDYPVRGKKDSFGCVLMGLVGWESVEACLKAKENEPFKGKVAEFKNLDGLLGFDQVNIKCQAA